MLICLVFSFSSIQGFHFQGVKPAALTIVNDPKVRGFIEKCLVPSSMRLLTSKLLKDPFLVHCIADAYG